MTLLGSILKLDGFGINPYFWLYSTILEGGDDARCFLNRHNVILLFVWLLPFTLLMRNAYTSSLYSLITKDPGPSYIPRSFDEILKNNEIKYLADGDHHYHILTKVGEWSRVSKLNEMVKLRNVFGKLMSNESVTMVIHNLLRSTNGLISCETLYGVNANVYQYYSLNESVMDGTCLKRKMFALLTSSDDVLEGGIVDKMLADLSGRLYLFESNEPSSFSELSVWSTDKSSYIDKTFSSFVAALGEAGILNYQQYQFDMIVIRMELDRMMSKYFNNDSNLWRKIYEALHKWKIFACLRFYKQVCSLDDINEEYGKVTGVSVFDLKVLWILFGLLVLVCVVIFLKEIGIEILLKIPIMYAWNI